MLISHGHGDRYGGAKWVADTCGAHVVASDNDWDLMSRPPTLPAGGASGRPAPKWSASPQRDQVASDGHALRLGDTTMMYCATPLGGMIASAVAYLATRDWRPMFYVGGVLPLLLLAPTYLRFHDAARADHTMGPDSKPPEAGKDSGMGSHCAAFLEGTPTNVRVHWSTPPRGLSISTVIAQASSAGCAWRAAAR